jgi:hypothetical protein
MLFGFEVARIRAFWMYGLVAIDGRGFWVEKMAMDGLDLLLVCMLGSFLEIGMFRSRRVISVMLDV